MRMSRPPKSPVPADAEPRRLLGDVVPALLAPDPLRADAHENPARERQDEEREEAETREHGRAARGLAGPADELEAERGDQAADEDRRAEDVQEERELHGQAPGL